ncbi:MAG: GNAT family N-acetyltransferase [Bdellovibrionota bacterium]|nr:GNAT family N-acetyltransferase [Bdellovibrionota bacterium]
MEIKKLTNPNVKSEVCNTVLRSLPLWFGIDSAIAAYSKDVISMDTWAAYKNNKVIGFISINKHFSQSAEIQVMAILPQFHRMGIGLKLLRTAENDLRTQGFKFLSVKTLSESCPNEEYKQTRSFYLKSGFTPLEEFKTLWDEQNPCLLLIKSL